MIDYSPLTTPIAFFIFNRPDTTARVFDAIRKARPTKLLVVADGPRPDRRGEEEVCAATRAAIEDVDWPCEVLTNYSEFNLGCKRRVASGLDWVFDTVNEAIILEDDCLPEPTFFPYCAELLDRYRDDTRIFLISGDNFQRGKRYGAASYYFSRYPHVWGWASWRRAWRNYDASLRAWVDADNREPYLSRFETPNERAFWTAAWDAVTTGGLDTWDYQLAFTAATQDQLCIVPQVNLVTNIGFGKDATHTVRRSRLANLPTRPMDFPLVHPEHVLQSHAADTVTRRQFFRLPPAPVRWAKAGLQVLQRRLQRRT
ncbi:MAG: glycosyltransferase family 2 protein [Chloroflexota bacterium]|nr:glycosyltransferase family 2 protein [Chloroflexota bacterium]